MGGLACLPPELLERVLCSPHLEHRDLASFAQTCARFHSISQSEQVWEKCFQREFSNIYRQLRAQWPSAQQRFSWRTECASLISTGHCVKQLVAGMSPQFHQVATLSTADFAAFDDLLLREPPWRQLYPVHWLMSMVEDVTDQNLTVKYYAHRVLRHLQHRLLRPKVGEFLEAANAADIGTVTSSWRQYETAMILIAQWCQPSLNLQEETLRLAIDQLSERVRQQLPGQLAESISQQLPGQLDSNPTLAPDIPSCRVILEAANTVLLQLEGFSGNSEDYYAPENSYINRVLETRLGIPITLSLLFTGVLGRLGVVCEPVNFLRHILLRWREHPLAPTQQEEYSYIDVFNGGLRLSWSEARAMLPTNLQSRPSSFGLASPRSAALRMLRNIISIGASQSQNMKDTTYSLLRSGLELMLLLNREEADTYSLMLSRVYLQLDINHQEVLEMLESISDERLHDQVDYLRTACQLQLETKQNRDNSVEIKKRAGLGENREVRFRVGQVAKHKKYNYQCVINGWDDHCAAPQMWMKQMGVERLTRKGDQPFYNVLVDDGSNRYAAEENLNVITPVPISNPEAGKYFKEFQAGKGYIPNRELAEQYPDDCP